MAEQQSTWSNPEEWERLWSGESCPICLRGQPLNIIAELEATFLTAGEEESPMKGYGCLVLKRHAVELYELPPAEAAALMRDIQRASKAVHEVTGAIKLNYEIHGNTLPHLHLHLFPRYIGDVFEGQPINPRLVKSPVYQPGEFAEFAARVQAAMK